MDLSPTTRFSNRVENYIKFRPHYPEELYIFCKETLLLESTHSIADIGSGTGFLTELFLKHGHLVYGVEPNAEMRSAAEKLLQNYPHFKSIEASAEESLLPMHSVDFILAGQAFHWFDASKAKKEFLRILKPKGHVLLIWNDRNIEFSPLLQAYEELLNTFGTDYQDVSYRYADKKVLTHFFAPNSYQFISFPNAQQFDFEGFKGRLLSSSYAPLQEDSRYEPMLLKLQEIFNQFQQQGKVHFEYQTCLYYGPLSETEH